MPARTAPLLPRPLWRSLLGNYLLTVAFCLVVATLEFYMDARQTSYRVPLVYSLCVGSATWAVIDLGRRWLLPAESKGWLSTWHGLALAVFGVAAGFSLGTWAADAWFGWSFWRQSVSDRRLAWAITALASVAAIYFFYSRSRRAYLQALRQQAELQAAEARLKLLQTQLEPHMLFNTLANLRALIGADPARAQDMLDRLIDYLRATLAASHAATHPLATEFQRLTDYLALIAVRMGPRLVYTLDLPPELAHQPVPTLLLQPLVENSIRHGLEPKIEGGRLNVCARRQGACIVLEVEDTGIGCTGSAMAPEGFGLAQVRERLITAYGPAATIKAVAPPSGGMRTLITFPG